MDLDLRWCPYQGLVLYIILFLTAARQFFEINDENDNCVFVSSKFLHYNFMSTSGQFQKRYLSFEIKCFSAFHQKSRPQTCPSSGNVRSEKEAQTE